MGYAPDQWAKEWLAKKRKETPEKVKGWTLEKHGDVHYIKWGSTEWDPAAKKYRKLSKHIGTLNPNGTVTEARSRPVGVERIPELPFDVKDYGNAAVLEKASERIFTPLREEFRQNWRELLAMAELRLMGVSRMNHADDSWRLMDDTRGIGAHMSPEILSDTLEAAGAAISAQEKFFDRIDEEERHMAADLSVVFSRSEGMTMLRKGYNRFRFQGTQFNIAAICGLETGKPCRLCMVCGNVKENSISGMLDEFGIKEGTVLIMDRGYCGKRSLGDIVSKGHDFVVALKRNSKAYGDIVTNEGHFTWQGRAIDYGRGKLWGYYAYRFEDAAMRANELYDKYKAEEDKAIEMKDREKAGNVMILSTLNIAPKEIYRMYKTRCAIENFFDTAKNDLGGDTTYLSTDLHVMGYNFVTFLAFCIWWEIHSWLGEAGMANRFTPRDVLRKFAAVKVYYTCRGPIVTDIPKDVRDLGERIGVKLDSGYIPQIS